MSKYNTNWWIGDGSLVRSIEKKEINNKTLVKFRIAISNGDRKTTFIDCEWWNPNRAIEYLDKGKEVCVAGNLLFDEWEKNGEKRSKHYINVQSLRLSSNKPKKEEKEEYTEYAEEEFVAELDSLIQE
jgi:single-stranded DNA-binding protein